MNKPVSIYLAGPIDDISLDDARGWRQSIAAIAPVGVLFYTPVDAYLGVSEMTAEKLDMYNRHAIAASDAVVANLSGPGRGFGTIREIEFSVRLGKPTVVIGELKSLLTFDLDVVETDVEALNVALELIATGRSKPTGLRALLLGEEDA